MRVAVAELPSPFLVKTRVLASGSNGAWHDLVAVLREAGIPDAPGECNLPRALAFLSGLPAGSRRRIEHALDRSSDGVAQPRLLKPLAPLSKILLTEGSLALSRSNDQRPATMVVGFSKFATALADPESAIRLPEPGARYDVEAVLAAVIGRPASRVAAAGAARSIVGFTLMAEITDRDMFETEARTNNSLFAKNVPHLSPLGPAIWIAGARELDPDCEITLSVNGALRQRFTVADFAHGVTDAVRAWSRVVLEPGDMVALGAAICRPRPGNEVDSPIPVAPGDRIEVACPAIGMLRATVSG
ncbi:MAG TPA: fumarylacetoacetate hydrolase family protein [Stellaceae bacterium]|nr:fumarylacetoacetate hydrolase family protein [Stellaceae bacterium]